jgi:membrane protease YdiL (CAAX protease family)
MDAEPKKKGANIVRLGILVEGILVVLAIGLSLLGVFDSNQPLHKFHWGQALEGLLWGVLASLPLIGFLAAFHFFRFKWIEGLRRFSAEQVKPLFDGSTMIELALLSVAAGIGEELFFRWCLQGGVTSALEPKFGWIVAVGGGLIIASLVFGLCHAATWQYFTLTFVGGLYLGWLMVVTGNWLVPAVAHALYDFVALMYIVNMSVPSRVLQETQT